jgi:hypothetical protein
MEWRHEHATLIPAEHADPGLSQIGVVVYAEIPLLIGVSTQNLCDFLTFLGDSVTRLRPDVEAITVWCRNAIERGAHHRFQPRPSSVQA